jgi:hypothetical protein
MFAALGGVLGIVQWLVVARRTEAEGSLWRGAAYAATSALAVLLSARLGGLMAAGLRADLLPWPLYIVFFAAASAAGGLVYAAMTGTAIVALLSRRTGS